MRYSFRLPTPKSLGQHSQCRSLVQGARVLRYNLGHPLVPVRCPRWQEIQQDWHYCGRGDCRCGLCFRFVVVGSQVHGTLLLGSGDPSVQREASCCCRPFQSDYSRSGATMVSDCFGY